jgi:predicted phage-related endonuclease
MVEVHQIKDRVSWLEMRRRNVGCSEAAALFSAHPYLTPMQLWAGKSGKLEEGQEDNAILRRGRILEAAVVEALQEEHPDWGIARPKVYYVDADRRLGCTPDAFATVDGAETIIQVKVVAPEKFDAEWSGGPPAHYLMQMQAEMFVSGRARGILTPMVADGWKYEVHEYPIEPDPSFIGKLDRALKAFWRYVEQGREPPLDAGDAGTLARLYPKPEAEAAALGDRDDIRVACELYETCGKQIKGLTESREKAAATICGALRNYSKGSLPGWAISWSAIPGSTYTATRKPHRRLTVRRAT